LGGTLVVVYPDRAVVRRMAVSAKTRFPAGQLKIFVARSIAVLGADVRRVNVWKFDGFFFFERPIHVRFFVATQVMVTGHPRSFQTGGEHAVVVAIAAHVFLAARTRGVTIPSFSSQLGFDRRTYETAQTHRPDRV